MKKTLVTSLCLLSVVTIPAYAVAADQNTNNNQQMEKISSKTQQLEEEVSELRQEVKSMHAERKAAKRQAARNNSMRVRPSSKKMTNGSASAPEPAISGPNTMPAGGTQYLPVDFDAPGQSFVTTGPYIGIPIEYSGSNLIINSPSINEDVTLLKIRKNINTRLIAMGFMPGQTSHSHVLLSGIIEAQALYRDIGGGPNSTDIDLSSANLDAYILGPSTWISGLMSLAYENDNGSVTGALDTQSRTNNSRLFINKAFIIVGDFLKSPVYGSVGQMYVPFGTYSSVMVSSPLTKLLFRTKARAINIGYWGQQKPDHFYGAAYIFRGDSHVGSVSRVNNGGINLGLKMKHEKWDADIGGGVIANIADSQGMQFTGNKPFWNGFGGNAVAVTNSAGVVVLQSTGSEQITHRVPAYDFRATIGLGNTWDFIGEYITASTNFNPNDMTYNSHGARPQALNAELAYTFQSFSKPCSVGVGYGMTKNALALGVPQGRWAAVFNTSLWRDTLQSLEFRHDINYPASATATGSNVAAPPSSGKSNNIVTAQFDLYF